MLSESKLVYLCFASLIDCPVFITDYCIHASGAHAFHTRASGKLHKEFGISFCSESFKTVLIHKYLCIKDLFRLLYMYRNVHKLTFSPLKPNPPSDGSPFWPFGPAVPGGPIGPSSPGKPLEPGSP